MEINMKETLHALRQKKNVTQEALAKHLGITPQSVGKWERGEGFPDITLLPQIALYFDVTIDDLLNVGKARIEEKIQNYLDESHRLDNTGEREENLALLERAYAEFPNDFRIMNALMSESLGFNADRTIELGKRILAESTDTELRENAIQCLCYAYCDIDEKEALHYAEMGGSIYAAREALYASVLEGEAGVEACQNCVLILIHHAAMTASMMTSKKKFTPQEKITAYQFSIDLLKLLFSDHNVGFYATDLSFYYILMAWSYAALRDTENTLKALEECSEYAIIASDTKKMQYTAPMVDRLKYDPSKTVQNYKGNVCILRLQDLAEGQYDFLREDERFKKIQQKLTAHAE